MTGFSDVPGECFPGVVELLPGVEQGEVHIGAPGEFERQEGNPLLGDRINPAESGNAADSGFEGRGDQRFHLLGSDTRESGDDGEARVSDVRQEVNAEAAKGHEAEQDDSQEEHGRRHRAIDRNSDDLHAPHLWNTPDDGTLY